MYYSIWLVGKVATSSLRPKLASRLAMNVAKLGSGLGSNEDLPSAPIELPRPK
jgi:hypothetical protein